MEKHVTLSPSQGAAAAALVKASATSSLLVLKSAVGMGRTTVLRQVHQAVGGALVGARQFMNRLSARAPEAIEEALLDTVESALRFRRIVIVDDFDLVRDVAQSYDYPRRDLLNTAVTG